MSSKTEISIDAPLLNPLDVVDGVLRMLTEKLSQAVRSGDAAVCRNRHPVGQR